MIVAMVEFILKHSWGGGGGGGHEVSEVIQRSQNILDGLHFYRKPENHRFYGIFQDARTEKSSGNKKTMLFRGRGA